MFPNAQFQFQPLNQHPGQSNSIIFDDPCIIKAKQTKSNIFSSAIYLPNLTYKNNILEYLPRLFTISTKNRSYKFNTEILKSTCNINEKFEYQIDIKDDENVLEKFEQLYQGKHVYFNQKDLPICEKITDILNISKCPNYMKSAINKTINNSSNFSFGVRNEHFIDSKIENGVIFSIESFVNFTQNSHHLKTFTIITHKKEYECNYYGVFASNIICDILQKDHQINRYNFDYEDEFEEFQLICDIFNFKKVFPTVDNIESIKKIAESLQISCVLEIIDPFLEEYEKISNKIDEKQKDIDEIDELFFKLHHIKEETVNEVKLYIIQSSWSKTIESVQELAAFILQVVSSDFLLHENMAELMFQLDKESSKLNKLDVLVPFIVNNLFNSFLRDKYNASFIFKLHKKGIISKKEIQDNINIFLEVSQNETNFNIGSDNRKDVLMLWFLPEIIEMNLFHSICDNMGTSINMFINSYYPDKMDDYKKMRESGEPDDELTQSLRKDDVDLLQSFILKNNIDVSNAKVPFNIYEEFVPNDSTNYINYSAAYGSIKCFKYLLLNHTKVDKLTYKFAVFGGSIEIIKIVDQKIREIDNSDIQSNNQKEFPSFGRTDSTADIIIPAIIKHRNDLFDWIYEQMFANKKMDENMVVKLEDVAAKNGNIHSLIEIIDTGYFLDYINVINQSSESGFYKFAHFFSTFKKVDPLTLFNEFQIEKFAKFGIVPIFDLYIKLIDYHNSDLSAPNDNFLLFSDTIQNRLERALLLALRNNSIGIIDYIFDNTLSEKFKINLNNADLFISSSVKKKTGYIFDYLIKRLKQTNSFQLEQINFVSILKSSCIFGNYDVAKFTIDFIAIHQSQFNFKTNFADEIMQAAKAGSKEICQYIFDKKLNIDFNKISSSSSELAMVNIEIFTLIYNNSPEENKYQFLLSFLYPAIKHYNYDLIEFLLKENAPCDEALINAVNMQDLKAVNIILKYNSKPSFVNKKKNYGTALTCAVIKNDLAIVKRLLSVPGIDPNIYSSGYNYPLVIAFERFNMEMINMLLDFYGDDLNNQTDQLDRLLETLFNLLFSDDSSKKLFVYAILDRILEIKSSSLLFYVNKLDLLNRSIESNNIDFFKKLLKLEKIDVNIYNQSSGDTPLIVATRGNNLEAFNLLINNPHININARNYNDETALTLAVQRSNIEIVDLLIKNENFDPEESRLDFAFFIAKKEIAKKLCSLKSLDVNYTNVYQESLNNDHSTLFMKRKETLISKYESVLVNCVMNNDIEKMNMLIKHPSFNKIKSNLSKAIYISIQLGNLQIFQKLIQLDNDCVNSIVYEFQQPLFLAILNQKSDILHYILNDPNFDSKKCNILAAFQSIFNINSISLEYMEEMYEYDQKHEKLIDFTQLLPSGLSCFTSFRNNNVENIAEIVQFLIQNGADPNKPDKNDVFPLSHAISINSLNMVCVLLDSGMIDYSRKIMINDESKSESKCVSYLHLAAKSGNYQILSEFINRKVIDVNVTDSKGETPLFYLRNNIKCIDLLFQMEDLDYSHCNNEGKDVLKLFVGEDATATSKEDYLNQLINVKSYSFHNILYGQLT